MAVGLDAGGVDVECDVVWVHIVAFDAQLDNAARTLRCLKCENGIEKTPCYFLETGNLF
mgnify:CR=1|jgi:hypothetical protein|tara:strand:+ start:7860 stop:8036 length:177 start_codon:yes stop_codon:yes gene_type:complete